MRSVSSLYTCRKTALVPETPLPEVGAFSLERVQSTELVKTVRLILRFPPPSESSLHERRSRFSFRRASFAQALQPAEPLSDKAVQGLCSLLPSI